MRRLVALAAVAVGCAAPASGDVVLYGTVFDAAPSVLFTDPAGLDHHRLAGATVTAYGLEEVDAAPTEGEGALARWQVAQADFSGEGSADFALAGEGITPGRALSLVVEAPEHAPTTFTGEVPEVSPDYPFFVFFDGALFSEPVETVRARVEALTGAPLADPPSEPVGCLVYGQLLSDPTLAGPEGPTPVEGAQVHLDVWTGAGWQPGPAVAYLGEELSPDPGLTRTSEAGVFWAAYVPEGPVELRVSPPGGAPTQAPFRTLCVEGGMIWLAAFYVVGAEASPKPLDAISF